MLQRLCGVGLILGTLFFAASLTPSLVPRTVQIQGLLAGLCMALGYGIGVLLRLLDLDAAPWAGRKLAQGFSPGNIDTAAFVATAARGSGPFEALLQFFTEARGSPRSRR